MAMASAPADVSLNVSQPSSTAILSPSGQSQSSFITRIDQSDVLQNASSIFPESPTAELGSAGHESLSSILNALEEWNEIRGFSNSGQPLDDLQEELRVHGLPSSALPQAEEAENILADFEELRKEQQQRKTMRDSKDTARTRAGTGTYLSSSQSSFTPWTPIACCAAEAGPLPDSVPL